MKHEGWNIFNEYTTTFVHYKAILHFQALNLRVCVVSVDGGLNLTLHLHDNKRQAIIFFPNYIL